MRLLIPLALLLAGCQAHMIETHGEAPKLTLHGLERPDKGGVVRYLRNGPSSWAARRRADAEKKMRAFCGGDYAVTKEGVRSQLGSSVPNGSSKATVEFDEYQYLVFDCR